MARTHRNDDLAWDDDYTLPSEFLRAERESLGGSWVDSEPLVLRDEDPEALADGRFCPDCGADVVGNDPHGPECPRRDDAGPPRLPFAVEKIDRAWALPARLGERIRVGLRFGVVLDVSIVRIHEIEEGPPFTTVDQDRAAGHYAAVTSVQWEDDRTVTVFVHRDSKEEGR